MTGKYDSTDPKVFSIEEASAFLAESHKEDEDIASIRDLSTRVCTEELTKHGFCAISRSVAQGKFTPEDTPIGLTITPTSPVVVIRTGGVGVGFCITFKKKAWRTHPSSGDGCTCPVNRSISDAVRLLVNQLSIKNATSSEEEKEPGRYVSVHVEVFLDSRSGGNSYLCKFGLERIRSRFVDLRISEETKTTTVVQKQREQQKTGRIELICGPMFSGKTSELMRRMRCYTIAKRMTIVVKYKGDERHPKSTETILTTHDGVVHEAVALQSWEIAALKCGGGRPGIPAFEEYDVIGIDEAQFFPGVADYAQYLANSGKIVVLAGLSGTYERLGFGDIPKILSIAEKVDVMSAVCNICGESAHFTKRLDEKNKELKTIGDRKDYEARCRVCFDL